MFYLALIISFIGLVISVYTVKKVPSINYFTVIFIIYALIIRPSAIYINEGSIITRDYFNIGDYEQAYLIASLFMISYVIGLYTGVSKLKFNDTLQENYIIYTDTKLATILFTMSIVSCIVLLYIGGADILFINRETTISMKTPILRYLYPFVTVLVCASTIHAILELYYKSYLLGILKIIVLLFITSVLAQRGFFIIFIIIALSLVIFNHKKQIYKPKLLILSAVVILTLFSKDLMTKILTDSQNAIQTVSIIERILYRPDGDATEVWMLTYQFLQNHDHPLGFTIINNIFNFLPHNLRHSLGFDNGQDILNGYYGGISYWDYGFGFNITLPIESYLNFSYFGGLIVYLAGYFMGISIVYFYKCILIYGQDPALSSLRLYAIWTITSSFAGIQWAAIFYMLYRLLLFCGYGLSPKLKNSIIKSKSYKR